MFYVKIIFMMVMNIIEIFARAWCVGVAIAAPPGPSSVLCVQTTLEDDDDSVRAFFVAAACTHGFYALLAASGFVALASSSVLGGVLFKSLASALLSYFAIESWFVYYNNAKLSMVSSGSTNSRFNLSPATAKFLFVISFYLSNPMTILGFVSFYSFFGVHPEGLVDIAACMLGTVVGSSMWRLFLMYVTGIYKEKLLNDYVMPVRCVCACCMSFFALCALNNVLHIL